MLDHNAHVKQAAAMNSSGDQVYHCEYSRQSKKRDAMPVKDTKHYKYIPGPGELPQQHRQEPGQYFDTKFIFKCKLTIESNDIFDMHAEGCSSEHVPMPMGKDYSKVQDLFLPEFGDKPNHPKTFMFPKQKFGDKKPTYRSFQSLWVKKWPWITYNEMDDKAFCIALFLLKQYNRKS